MELKITRWHRPGRPNEHMLRDLYQREGLAPYIWSNSPYDAYEAHTHGYDKVLYVVAGSITWIIGQGRHRQEFETFPGDRIDLPHGTVHAALVGPEGVTCLEAHL
ncbi:MAG: cupin [Chloroflexota bacterium]